MQIGPGFWGGLCWVILSSEFRSALASGAVSAGPSLGVLAMQGVSEAIRRGLQGYPTPIKNEGEIFSLSLSLSRIQIGVGLWGGLRYYVLARDSRSFLASGAVSAGPSPLVNSGRRWPLGRS